jgi:hypothetical protein
MADESLQQWLQDKQRGEFGTLPRDADALYAFLTGQESAHPAAQALVEDVSSEPIDPDSDRAWRAWQLLFAAFAELPQYHDALVDLVVAVAAIPPSDPDNGTSNRMMRNLGAQYRDEYDALQTHRHLRQKNDVQPALRLTGEEKSFNFVVCSAKLANTGHSGFVQMFGAFAFFDLRDVFEMTLEHYREEHLDLIHQDIVSPMQARSSDVETACQWIIHGGVAIRTMNNEVIEGFESGASEPTDFWDGAEGISEERWTLWRTRMGAIESENLSESAKEALRRAKGLINSVAVD